MVDNKTAADPVFLKHRHISLDDFGISDFDKSFDVPLRDGYDEHLNHLI